MIRQKIHQKIHHRKSGRAFSVFRSSTLMASLTNSFKIQLIKQERHKKPTKHFQWKPIFISSKSVLFEKKVLLNSYFSAKTKKFRKIHFESPILSLWDKAEKLIIGEDGHFGRIFWKIGLLKVSCPKFITSIPTLPIHSAVPGTSERTDKGTKPLD